MTYLNLLLVVPTGSPCYYSISWLHFVVVNWLSLLVLVTSLASQPLGPCLTLSKSYHWLLLVMLWFTILQVVGNHLVVANMPIVSWYPHLVDCIPTY